MTKETTMMRRIFLTLAFVSISCVPQPEADQPASQSRVLPAPTPSDVALRIHEAQNGQQVDVVVGQRFAVELVGVPTAGYVWAPTQIPAFLSRAGEAGGNTVAEQSQPGYAGGNHWEVLMFAATAPGSGELVLEQRRPWETSEPATRAFRVTIVAR
jgi:inhibitor of cysteine peptidase